jgi:ABC-type lipoprotein export system ATPase subunit
MKLEVVKLRKSFGDRVVLSDISFSMHAGSSMAIVGPSGSGKSTLLNILGSLVTPDSGTVRLGDVSVDKLTGHALEAYRSRMVGFVFQDHLLLPHLNALENVLLPFLGTRTPIERGKKLLGEMGLGDRMFDFPATLSGGERQRVALARALIHEPEMLLADEPTGNLDHDRASEQVDLLLREAEESDRIVVMVTHNLELARRFHRVLKLDDGFLIPGAT